MSAWTGAAASPTGPAGLAERLAARLASGSAGARSLRLGVSGIQSLDAYGLVLGYLQGLDVVESLSLVAVAADDSDIRPQDCAATASRWHGHLRSGAIVSRAMHPAARPRLRRGGLPPDMSYRLNATAGAPAQ